MYRWELYESMRNEGMTYGEIAQRCGVTYQCVAQALAKRGIGHFKPYLPKECVYDGLREWMNQNRVSRSDLSRLFYECPIGGGRYYDLIRRRLIGSKGFSMGEIDKLIEASGLTYEQLFRSGRWSDGKEESG